MIRIITDSTSSLPKDLREKLGIHLLNLVVNHGGVSHVEGEMDLDAFYADIYEMADDIPTSSQPSALSIEAALEEAAAAGDEVLGIFISGRMSGTFEGVARAARETAKRHPDFKYALIDSMTNCMELGWAVVAACEARDAGGNLEECVEAVTHAMSSTRFIFAPESLKFLEKGGRIGKASALLGNMLNISPILTVKNGEAATFSKVRTQKKALIKMVDVFKRDVENYGLRNVAVHYIGSCVPAFEWAREVIDPLVGKTVMVLPASPVIGVHVGPAMGLAYECAAPIEGKFVTSPEIIAS